MFVRSYSIESPMRIRTISIESRTIEPREDFYQVRLEVDMTAEEVIALQRILSAGGHVDSGWTSHAASERRALRGRKSLPFPETETKRLGEGVIEGVFEDEDGR